MQKNTEDEAEQLKQANESLRTELETLKLMVEELRERRGEQTEDFLLLEQDDLLQLENELLRAQLREQEEFLAGCRALMQSIPELSSTSSQEEATPSLQSQQDLLKQGQENSLTHLLLLVSRSQTANDWKAVQLPPHVFTASSAVPGFNVTCNFRKEIKDPVNRPGESFICLRVDGCFPNIPPETVAQGYWNTWNSERFFSETFGAFFNSSSKASAPPVPFMIKELMSQDAGFEVTKVNLYREQHSAEAKDWIYCLTKVKREIALSTLSLPPELNPSVATRRVQHTRKVVSGALPSRKRNKGCASSSQLMGRQECIVLARSCVKDTVLPAGDAAVPSSRHAFDEEGLFVWQDEVSIDFEVQCDEGKELQRKRVPAARASAFISISSKAFPVQDVDLYSALVTASGQATEKYAKLIDMFYALMAHGEEAPSL